MEKVNSGWGWRDVIYLGLVVLMGWYSWGVVRKVGKIGEDIEDVRIRSNYIYTELSRAQEVLKGLDSLSKIEEDGPVYNINRYYYEVLSVSRSDVSGDTLVVRINEMLGK